MVARVCGDLAPPPLGMEAIGLDLAIAGHDGAHQRHDAGVGVVERQRIVDALLALAQRCEAPERGIPRPHRDHVAVREDAALRPSRGAGGVEDAGGGLRARRPCRGRRRRCRQPFREALRYRDRRLVRALRQGLSDLALAGGERQHQIGLAVLEQVGGLARPVVRIDRHAADADACSAPACAARARGGSRAASPRDAPGRSPRWRRLPTAPPHARPAWA